MKQVQRSSMNIAIWGAFAATLAFMLLASSLPSERLWGLNWYGYFSWYGKALLLVLGVIVPILLSRWQALRSAHPGQDDSKPFWPVAGILIFVLVSIYVLLSARTHFLGDGYQLLSRLETAAVPIRPWNMGAYFLVENVYSLLGGAGESQAELAFRIVSWLSGLIYLGGAALTAARLYNTRRDRLLFFGGVASGGFTLLFFGYAENYPPLVVLLAGVTFLGLLALSGKLSKWWLLLPAAGALLVHPFAVALLPATLFALVQDTRIGRWYLTLESRTVRLLWALPAILGLAAIVWAYQSSLFIRFSLLPVFTNEFTVEGYTLFSLKHLLDFTNLLFLLVPGFLYLIWILVFSKRQQNLAVPQYLFLVLLVIPSLLIVLLFDPKLGMPRDWDMFAFSGVPLVMLLYYALLDGRNRVRGYALAAALSIALGFLVLLPRAVTQFIPEVSIAVFDSYSNLDMVRNGSGRFLLLQYLEKQGRMAEKNAREAKNARVLHHQIWDIQGQNLLRDGKITQAETKFRQAIAAAPNYSYSWANIGNCFARREQWDSALMYFRIADGLNPFNSDTYNSLGFAYSKHGEIDKAYEYCQDALRLRPTNFTARENLANLYHLRGQKEKIIALVLEAMQLDSIPTEYFYLSADQLLKLGETEVATQVCRRALEEGVDSSMFRKLEAENPQYRFRPPGP